MVIYEYWADSLWCIDMQAVCFWCSINPYRQLRCTETLYTMAEVNYEYTRWEWQGSAVSE